MKTYYLKAILVPVLVTFLTSCASTTTNEEIIDKQIQALGNLGFSNDNYFCHIPSAPWGLDIVPAGQIKRGERSEFVESLKNMIIKTHQNPEIPFIIGGESSNMNSLVATASISYFADDSLRGRTIIFFGTKRDYTPVEREVARTGARSFRVDIP